MIEQMGSGTLRCCTRGCDHDAKWVMTELPGAEWYPFCEKHSPGLDSEKYGCTRLDADRIAGETK